MWYREIFKNVAVLDHNFCVSHFATWHIVVQFNTRKSHSSFKKGEYLTLHCFTKQIRYFTFKSNDFVHQCLIYFIPFFQANSSSPFYDFKAIDIDGVEQSLSKYAGHVCIVVNVASKWGKTGVNYQQLVALQQKV